MSVFGSFLVYFTPFMILQLYRETQKVCGMDARAQKDFVWLMERDDAEKYIRRTAERRRSI